MTVAELLADESKWTKRAYSRSEHGMDCAARSPFAACWCLSGAIDHCYRDWRSNTDASTRLSKYLATLGFSTIPAFNDHHSTTFKDVLLAARRAKI